MQRASGADGPVLGERGARRGRLQPITSARLLAQAGLLCNAVLLPALHSLQLHRVFLLQEMPLQRALASMEARGIALDTSKVSRLRSSARMVLDAIHADARDALGGMKTGPAGSGAATSRPSGVHTPSLLPAFLTASGTCEILMRVSGQAEVLSALSRGLHEARARPALATPGRWFEAEADCWGPSAFELQAAISDLNRDGDQFPAALARQLKSRAVVYCLMAFGSERLARLLRAMVGARVTLRALWHANSLLRAVHWQPGSSPPLPCVLPELTSCGPTGRVVASAPAVQSLPSSVRLPRLAGTSLADALQQGIKPAAVAGMGAWVLDAGRLGQRLEAERERLRAAAAGRLSAPRHVRMVAGGPSGGGTGAPQAVIPGTSAAGGPPDGATAAAGKGAAHERGSSRSMFRRGVIVEVL